VNVDFADKEAGDNYVDEGVDVKKDWRDEYLHDAEGRRTGWTRRRGEKAEEFTADGAVVLTKDDKGRPATAREVRYVARQERGKVPLLDQKPGDTILHYEYTAEDRFGHVKLREKAAP
jgi:hypothetical protein